MANIKSERLTRESLEPSLAASMLYYDYYEFQSFLQLFREIENNKELAPVGPFLTYIKYLTSIFKASKKTGEELNNNSIYNQILQLNSLEQNKRKREQFELWMQQVILEDSSIMFELGEDLFYHYLWLTHLDKINLINNSNMSFKEKLNYKPNRIEFSENEKTFMALSDIIPDENKDLNYYSTGVDSLDDYVIPRNSNFMVVAARPGVGKSIFMLQMALENASKGIKCLFISMEMSAFQLKKRIMNWYADDLLEVEDWPRYENQAKYKMLEKNLSIVIAGGKSAESIIDLIQESIELNESKIIFLDYLQITRYSSLDEWKSLRELTFNLKRIATSNNILMVSCSQVSRESSNYGIELSSLFGSSTIENDTDIVLGLETIEKDNFNDSPEVDINIKILKNREGLSSKKLHQELNRATMKFRSI